jgi:hypothetical protein
LRSCIARSTLLDAFLPYFLAIHPPFRSDMGTPGPPPARLPAGGRTRRRVDVTLLVVGRAAAAAAARARAAAAGAPGAPRARRARRGRTPSRPSRGLAPRAAGGAATAATRGRLLFAFWHFETSL